MEITFKGHPIVWGKTADKLRVVETGRPRRFVTTSEDRQCLRCGGLLDYIYHIYFICRKCGRWERGGW